MVGVYKGIAWRRKRICDVLAVRTKARWYFPLDKEGNYTGDHFRTQKELFNWIEEKNDGKM